MKEYTRSQSISKTETLHDKSIKTLVDKPKYTTDGTPTNESPLYRKYKHSIQEKLGRSNLTIIEKVYTQPPNKDLIDQPELSTVSKPTHKSNLSKEKIIANKFLHHASKNRHITKSNIKRQSSFSTEIVHSKAAKILLADQPKLSTVKAATHDSDVLKDKKPKNRPSSKENKIRQFSFTMLSTVKTLTRKPDAPKYNATANKSLSRSRKTMKNGIGIIANSQSRHTTEAIHTKSTHTPVVDQPVLSAVATLRHNSDIPKAKETTNKASLQSRNKQNQKNNRIIQSSATKSAKNRIVNQPRSLNGRKLTSESLLGNKYPHYHTRLAKNKFTINPEQIHIKLDNQPKPALPYKRKRQTSTYKLLARRNRRRNVAENKQKTKHQHGDVVQSVWTNISKISNPFLSEDQFAPRWIGLETENAKQVLTSSDASIIVSTVGYFSTTETTVFKFTPENEVIYTKTLMTSLIPYNTSEVYSEKERSLFISLTSKEAANVGTTENLIIISGVSRPQLHFNLTVNNMTTLKPLSVKEKEREEEYNHESLFSKILRFFDKKLSYQYYGFTASIRLQERAVASGCIINEDTVLTVLGTTSDFNEDWVIIETLNALKFSVRVGQKQESQIEDVVKIIPLLNAPFQQINGSLIVLLKVKHLFEFGKTIYAANINNTGVRAKQLVVAEWQRGSRSTDMDIPVSLNHYSVTLGRKCTEFFGRRASTQINCIRRPTKSEDYCGRLGSLLVERKTNHVLGILTYPNCNRTAGFTPLSKLKTWIEKLT